MKQDRKKKLLCVVMLIISMAMFGKMGWNVSWAATQKEVTTEQLDEDVVLVGGMPIGIYMETDGVLVLNTQKIKGIDGKEYNPAEKQVKSGDYIIGINGVEIHDKKQLTKQVEKLNDQEVELSIYREQKNLNVKIKDNQYIITKEWYTDPFADSLNLENIKSDDIRSYILAQQKPDIQLTQEQQKAIDYAHRYCGVSTEEEYEFKFNREYKNFNPDGGDCANFASQIMYESGRFKKNSIWNYNNRDGTKAWVNAQGFKNYILNSGRGSLICKGSYEETYKESYNLRPGDFVAYEKGGRITHVSTVTGMDSKGYPLVTCHNTDRLLVPWDLGWSNKTIRFHLIRVHY